ncbi:MAG: type II toxin-antitoxin system CcdA family antitoxin [Pseudomonadota bacterium]
MPIPANYPDAELLAEIRQLHGTKSAQIRALAEAGWPTARIAKALSIRYQHAYNVLHDAKKHVEAFENSLKTAGVNQSDLPEIANIAENVTASFAAAKETDYAYLQDALAKAPQANKKPVNLSINASLLAAARSMNINLSETLERELSALLSQQTRARWQAENSAAIEAHNQFVERNGLWSDGLRQF